MTPDDTTDLIQQLKDQAARLGLIWLLQAATVADPATPTVTFDADPSATATPVVNLLSIPLAGDRVWVVSVPPAGNYMIGRNPAMDPARMDADATNGASAAGTTTSAAYADMPGSPAVTITKAYTNTRLKVDFHATCFSTAVTTVVRFAAGISGVGDGDIAQLFFNPAATHLQVSGSAIFPVPVSGSVTVTGRWRRVAGAGTISTDANDWVSISVQEII
jgi:hypothetical protein